MRIPRLRHGMVGIVGMTVAAVAGSGCALRMQSLADGQTGRMVGGAAAEVREEVVRAAVALAAGMTERMSDHWALGAETPEDRAGSVASVAAQTDGKCDAACRRRPTMAHCQCR